MKRISILPFIFIVGCGGGSTTNYNPNGNNSSSIGAGALDGNWKVQTITCNGTVATGEHIVFVLFAK